MDFSQISVYNSSNTKASNSSNNQNQLQQMGNSSPENNLKNGDKKADNGDIMSQLQDCNGNKKKTPLLLDNERSDQVNKRSEFQVEFELPFNIQDEGIIQKIEAYRESKSKLILYYLSVLLSCGLVYLLCRWNVNANLFFRFKGVKSGEKLLQKATHFLIWGYDDNVYELIIAFKKKMELVQKKFNNSNIYDSNNQETEQNEDQIDNHTDQHNEYLCINFRLYTYYLSHDYKIFKPIQTDFFQLTQAQIHEQYGKGIGGEKQYMDTLSKFGKNDTEIPPKTSWQIFMDEILSPFYLFQLFSVTLWYVEDYYYYSTVIAGTSILSIAVALTEAKSNYSKLREMSYFETKVNVYRGIKSKLRSKDNNNLQCDENIEQQKIEISSHDLVPGDIIEVPENQFIPCDMILLNGQAVMNESMLTGESIPVLKNSLPFNDVIYNPDQDGKQVTLFSGTKCIETRYYMKGKLPVLGLVSQTSFNTIKGQLVRSILFPKASSFQFYADSLKFVAVLAVISLLGFLASLRYQLKGYHEGYFGVQDMILKSLDLITVTVPPALPTCLSIGITFAMHRLKKRQIFCISPPKVNICGQVTIMCFDKTGTLTEDGLDLKGIRTIQENEQNHIVFAPLEKDITSLSQEHYLQRGLSFAPRQTFLEMMASCHALTRVQGELIGDPLELKMFEATKWVLEEQELSKFDELVSAIVKPKSVNEELSANAGIGIIQRFEFSSQLQRMSTIIRRQQDNNFTLFTKGSPEKIFELCRKETIPNSFHQVLDFYAQQGFRVLAFGMKELKENYRKIQKMERDDVEFDLTFVGLIIMENKLKPITTETIELLHRARVKTVMVTGDNALTAISVGRQCGIIPKHHRVYLGDTVEETVQQKQLPEKQQDDNDSIIEENQQQQPQKQQQQGKLIQITQKIQWKDFESSQNQLNQTLEAEHGAWEEQEHYDKNQQNLQKELEKERKLDEEEKKRKQSSFKKSQRKLTITEMQRQSEIIASLQNFQEKEGSQESDNPNIIYEIEAPPFYEEEHCSVAITGRAFSFLLQQMEEGSEEAEKLFKKMIQKTLIFARMKPEEKALMIEYQQQSEMNPIVGMCGDGANDCSALKTANIGISLSDAEASIAAPFTSKIQDISCVITVLKEGRAALVTSFQCFKYMALYSMIQFSTVSLLYFILSLPSDFQFLYWDLFIIIPLAFLMGFTESTDHLTHHVPGSKLISFPVLCSVIGQTIIQGGFQIAVFIILKHQSWYVSCPKAHKDYFQDLDSSGDQMKRCYEPTILFWVSNFQYIVVCIAFSIGKPWRKPFYTNKPFTISLIIVILLTTTIQLVRWKPFESIFLYLYEIKKANSYMPNYVPFILIGVSVVNAICTYIFEKWLLPLLDSCHKSFTGQHQHADDYDDNQSIRGSSKATSSNEIDNFKNNKNNKNNQEKIEQNISKKQEE